MRSSGLRLAVVIAAIYSIFAGFMSTVIMDESMLDGSTQIFVSGSAISEGGDGLPAIAQNIADSSESVIVKQVRDLHDTNVRNLFVVVGNENAKQARWLTDGFPDFSRNRTSNVHSVSDLKGLDPRGKYYIFGNATADHKVTEEFEKLGYSIEYPSGSAAEFVIMPHGPTGPPTVVTLLLISLISGLSAISQMKRYAIQRLHGNDKKSVMWQAIKSLFPGTAIAILTLCCGSIISLYFYNGLNQFGRLAQTTSIIFVIAVTFAIAVHLVVLLILWNSSIIEGLKGRLGFRVAVPAAYLIRIPGILLAVSLIASSFAAATAVQDAAATRAEFNNAGNTAKIVFEGLMPPAEMESLSYEYGAWLKQEDKAGRTLLAAPFPLVGDQLGASQNILLVNNAYLNANPILNDVGEKLDEVSPSQLRAFIPENSSVSQQEIENFLSGISSSPETTNHLSFGRLSAGQNHFLYEPGVSRNRYPQWMQDPVVVVVGADSGLIRDDDYLALATRGRVLMTDSETAIENTPNQFMGQWISAYIPVAQTAADQYGDRVSEFKVIAASSLIAMFVLLATAVGLAQMHVQGNAQSILVRYLHGWTFYSTHRWLVRAELLIFAVVTAWSLVRFLILLIQPKGGDVPATVNDMSLAIATWQPLAVAVVAVINLVLLIGLVQFRTQRMIRTHSEETA